MTESRTTVLVAAEDGKPGCPAPVWYDGVYGPFRCGFGRLGTCHQHGTFETKTVDQERQPAAEGGVPGR